MRFYRRRRRTPTRRNSRPRGRFFTGRAKTLEVLESREMLAGDVGATPWHNALNPADVNYDQRVSPIDALVIINDLLANGSHAVDATAAAPLSSTSDPSPVYYRDVSGDNRVSPLDLLIVVNELLDEELMLVNTFATDMADNPITTITVGSQYKLRTEVQDIRDPVASFPGVFSAAADVDFGAALSSIDVGQSMVFGDFFNLIQESTLEQGRVIGYGATQNATPPGNDPQFLWSVVLTATAAGPQAFMPGFSDDIDHENVLLTDDDALLLVKDQIRYVGSTLTITDVPSLSINDVEQDEDAGVFNFTVTLTGDPTEDVTVTYTSFDGTGPNAATLADNDYELATNVLTFEPGGARTMLIPVTVNADSKVEDDEVFSVMLSSPSANATISKAEGIGTILNDDMEATLAIGSVQRDEDSPGTFDFTVTISGEYTENVTVNFATNDGGGANGATVLDNDYQPTSGALTFVPGEATSIVIPVTVNADLKVEDDEVFNVVLSSPSPNAIIDTPLGVGTIVNDDVLASLSIASTTVDNVTTGTTTATFTVTLSESTAEPVTVAFATSNISALAGVDYVATSGTLTFTGGSQTETIPVTIIGDSMADDVDTFLVTLSDPSSNASIDVAQATGTINPAVSEPSVSVSDVTLQEGDAGITEFAFTITLASPSSQVARVSFETMDGTAQVGANDYVPISNAFVEFAIGETSAEVLVAVLGDTAAEPNETFFLKVAAIEGATGEAVGTGTIVDDDGAPMLTVSDAGATPGAGIAEAVFTVTLSGNITQPVSVGFATADDSATAGIDYIAVSGSLNFTPGGSRFQEIPVTVLGGSAPQPDKTFFMNLSSQMPDDVVIADARGIGTIVTQGLLISDAVVVEGNASTTDAVFTVTLSRASTELVTVAFATADDTATVADSDYVPADGTLTFQPGEQTQTITVVVNGDTTAEGNEKFFVNLSDPVGAPLFDTAGVGTILNDDGDRVALRLEVADLMGVPLPFNQSLDVGDEFLLRVFVTDVQADPTGVFQTFLDVSFQSNLVEPVGAPMFGQFYDTVTFGTISSGLLDDFGAFGEASPPADPSAELLLFRLQFRAISAGLLDFVGSVLESDLNQDNETLLYFPAPDTPVPSDEINVENRSINIGSNELTVSNTSAPESENLVFTITRFIPDGTTATVEYATANGTAVAGEDYVAQSGTLTFEAGQSNTQTVTVEVINDPTDEPDETLSLVLSAPVNAEVGPPGTGTILDDDDEVSVSAGDSSAEEGDDLIFTVSLSAASGKNVTVNFATTDPSSGNVATAGVDYTPTAGALTFSPGITQQLVTVQLLSDTEFEPDEMFQLALSGAQNASIGSSGVGTIINDDPPPLLSIADAIPQAEDSQAPFVFEVSLSKPALDVVTVNFMTTDGIGPNAATAADDDFEPVTGTVSFQVGQTTQFVTVSVNSDLIVEPDETFNVVLSDASPEVLLGTSVGVGTILNDDPPALVIGDATAAAKSVPTTVDFTVTLSQPFTEEVTVGFATEDDSARQGVDYVAQTGNLVFAPGVTSRTISVTILGSAVTQPDKMFFMNLSSQMPEGVVIADDRGIGTIVTQGLSIGDAVVVEGNSSTRNAVFTVSQTRVTSSVVTVFYSTADGTATVADNDYVAASGALTFQPGEQTQQITVQVVGDTKIEGNERFSVNLSDAVGAPLFLSEGIGTILNDDGDRVAIRLELADALTETPLPIGQPLDLGDEFLLRVFVTDVQPEPTGVFQTFLDVTYESSLVEPVGAAEFGPFYDTVTFGTLRDGLLDDFGAFGESSPPADPSQELLLFQIQFKAINNGLVEFIGSVLEEDLNEDNNTLLYFPAPDTPVPSDEINVENRSINIGTNVLTVSNEMEPESNNLVFTITRFLPDNTTATVVYSTDDGTALAGQDYVAQTGTLTFEPGQPTTQTVTVEVINDTTDEPNETMSLVLSDVVNAILGSPGTGTILDDDPEVSVSASNASADEGDNLVFTVSLSAVSGKTVTVNFNTADPASGIAATAGVDYTPTSGPLTFSPGTTQQLVTVESLGDIEFESNETFQLALSDPQNASLGTPGLGTIVDVPPAGISGFVFVDLNNNGIKEGNEKGIQGAIVTATRQSDDVSVTTTTREDGSYVFNGLIPGTYTVMQTQPGFYNDGRDVHNGVESTLNDQYTGIVLAPSAREAGYNFGERGVRGEFIAAFINRRALFATSVVGGLFEPTIDMPGSILDLRTGDIWVSFDGGWEGLRTIEALFDSSQGVASMKLYNNALQEVALSAPTAAGAVLLFNGQLGETLFLRISGTNPNVTVQISEAALSGFVSEPGGDDQNQNDPLVETNPTNSELDPLSSGNRFASAQPMIASESEPLVDSDASDEALSEDEDWILETMLV